MLSTRSRTIVLTLLVCSVSMLREGGSQSSKEEPTAIRGFSVEQAKTELTWEQKMLPIPRPDLMRAYQSELAAAPHHVGSPKGKANAEWLRTKFESFGLRAEIEEFQVLYPTPKERHLELMAPERYVAQLKEPPVAGDPQSAQSGQLPTYNVFSADGDVTAEVVYVNYGIPDDYETLRKLGVDVKGKVVLARYGGSWRGIKPKVAYEHGASACLIYSDPKDDGYYQGLIYPEGPYRPEQGVQRGSVLDMPLYPGDPLTPGIGAVAGAKRIPIAEATTIMKLPVMPISSGDALPILKNLRGPVAPEAWRGALPITYCIGPGPAVVHFRIASDWLMQPVYDVIARIDGSTFPDEWVIQGNHHDAWVNGASDPISGIAAELEEARALGELLKQGWRPKRTIIFAAWDGEEPGLFGSTEWVEQHAAELEQKAVAYVNTDSNGKGWLDASGSHSLEHFVNEVARSTTDPVHGKSVFEALKAHRLESGSDETRRQIAQRADLAIGALGSGSDYTAFIDHLGVASLNLGFGGEGGGGVYHSIYDNQAWFDRFSDSQFAYGQILAQLDATVMMRLAGASVLPFQFKNLADAAEGYVAELVRLPGGKDKIDPAPLHAAVRKLKQSAQDYEKAYDRAAAAGTIFQRTPAELHSLNQRIYRSERALTAPEGLPGRSWFRHQLYAPGFYTGYGVKTIPYVREAMEQQRWQEAAKGIEITSRQILALAEQLDGAAKALKQAP
jgi:N-acetylated-alpha-linked acidic dipeptidase